MTAHVDSVAEMSTGELVSRISEDLSTLVRDEFRLAQAETSEKAKKLGAGAGLVGGAGVLVWFGVGAFIAAAILGLARAVDAWLAAILVGGGLMAIAGAVAVIGKWRISAAGSPMPDGLVPGIKTDLKTLREGTSR